MYRYDRHDLLGEGMYRHTVTNNPELPTGSLWDAYNMTYSRSSEDPEKMPGYTRLGSTDIGGAVTGLADYSEGTRLIAGCVDGGIYEYAGSNFAISTGASAGTYNTTATTRWAFTMFYGGTTSADLLVGMNGVDAPAKYTSGAGFSALGGGAVSGMHYPTAFAGRLWAAKGDTLYYTSAGDAEDFSGGGNFQIERGSGDITGLYVNLGNLLIFKRRKIFQLRFEDRGTLNSTSIRDVHTRIGCVSHWTIQEVGANEGGNLFWVSETGPQAHVMTNATGGYKPVQVADSIRTFLNNRVDKSNHATSWAHFNEDRGEYYYQYGTNSSTPAEGLIANVARHRSRPRWTRHTMNGMMAGATYRISGVEIQAFGDSDGRIYRMHTDSNNLLVYSRNTAGYTGRLIFPGFSQGYRGHMKKYGRTFVDIEGQANVTAKLNMGRGDLPGSAANQSTISGMGALDGWGVGEWGVAVWGGSSTLGRWIRPNKAARGAYIRPLFETSGPDSWFRVSGIQTEYILQNANLAA